MGHCGKRTPNHHFSASAIRQQITTIFDNVYIDEQQTSIIGLSTIPIRDIVTIILHQCGKLTSQQLTDLTTGLNICSMFFSNAISTWQNEFSVMLTNLENRSILFSIVIGLMMVLLHVIIFELVLLAHLRKDYRFMREVFPHWVPYGILTKEKVIKLRFYQSGILSAS